MVQIKFKIKFKINLYDSDDVIYDFGWQRITVGTLKWFEKIITCEIAWQNV